MNCNQGEYATKDGICLKDPIPPAALQESKLGGVFKNQGTPFYVLVITVLFIELLSFLAYYSKEGKKQLLQLPLGEHAVKFGLNYAGVMSEFILMIGVFQSGDSVYFVWGVVNPASQLEILPGCGRAHQE